LGFVAPRISGQGLIAGKAFASMMDSPKAEWSPDGNNCWGHRQRRKHAGNDAKLEDFVLLSNPSLR
jgi:hypothetical protein